MNSHEGMPGWMKQAQAASRIRELLLQRGFDIPSQPIALDDKTRWSVFEREGRQVGIDPASGIWLRASDGDKWRCVAAEYMTSGECMAVEFLVGKKLPFE